MEWIDNPNYYPQEKPYKPKYICFDCRKCFKRKVATDIPKLNSEIQKAKCPDCGVLSSYIGPKFRPPKANNTNEWESIRTLSKIGILHFRGFATNKIRIPTSRKSLIEELKLIREICEKNIDKWLSQEYAKGNKEQISIFSDVIKKIDLEMKASR